MNERRGNAITGAMIGAVVSSPFWFLVWHLITLR